MDQIDLPADAKFITFGSSGVEDYEIQVAEIILVGGEAVPLVKGDYKEYTLTTIKDCADASMLGFKAQIDNKGTLDADGDTLTIKGLSFELTVNGAKQTISLGDVELKPDQYYSPTPYAKSNCRVRMRLTGSIEKGSTIVFKALSGTIEGDMASRKSDIYFTLQVDGGDYQELLGYNQLFADAE